MYELPNLIRAPRERKACIRHNYMLGVVAPQHARIQADMRSAQQRNVWIVALAVFKRRFRKLRRDAARVGEKVFA